MADASTNLRLYAFSFNMETVDPFKPPFKPKNTVEEILARSIPTDCDVYVIGLQESVGNNFLDTLNAHMVKIGVVLADQAAFKKAKITGRGDGALLVGKTTRIAVWVKAEIKDECTLQGMVPFSFGKKKGSKGAVGMVVRIFDTTVACISCHLSAAALAERVDQYRKVVDGLGNTLGNKFFQLNSQFHHILWMGDMNYRLMDIEIDKAVSLLSAGNFKELHDKHDELACELGRGNIFVGYEEPKKDFDGGFCPSYKKDVARECEDHTDPDWVSKTYLVDFKQQWYKGGRVKVRIPAWCDRMLVHSLEDRKGDMTPERVSAAADNYNAINDVLLTSDHSPVYCYYTLAVKRLPVMPESMYRLRLSECRMADAKGTVVPIKHVKTLVPLPFELANTVPAATKTPIEAINSGGKELAFVGMNTELQEMDCVHHMALKFHCKDLKGECTVALPLRDFVACKTLKFKEALNREGLALVTVGGDQVFAEFTLTLASPDGDASAAAMAKIGLEPEPLGDSMDD